ncbi:MAG TPA: YicC/YloC family endoribonuclease [Tetragenococcus sp.]|nr:YicC/YloC family endoribonuclease [Tetragenococcus sp.]
MKSMTGFGKAIQESKEYQIEVEVKSVNHRFLDIQLHLPRELSQYETLVRQWVNNTIQRGRVEVWIQLHAKIKESKEVTLRWDLIEAAVRDLQQKTTAIFGEQISAEKIIVSLLAKEEIIEIKDQAIEDENLDETIKQATQAALAANDQSRRTEGEQLAKVLEENRQLVVQQIQAVINLSQTYEADYKQKLQAKLNEYLKAEVDQDRLLTETAIIIQRGDIHEELDRMQIHLQTMQEILQHKIPIGRKLDFLIQEMNREVNTIGSKSAALPIKNLVVEMKTTIEKLREQVQNVQ